MSTNDVPGAKASNNDELAALNWAEHDDGSCIFVLGTENDEVVYSMFDVSTKPITEFRNKMPMDEFKEFYSWDSKNSKSVKWTWHDKTPFPWDTIIKKGAKDGVLPAASAYDQLSAAAAVAKVLGLTGAELDDDVMSHLMSKKTPKDIMKNIQNKISMCPVGKPSNKLKRLLKKKEKIEAKIKQEMA